MEPQMKRWKGLVCDTDSWVVYPVLSDEQYKDIELIEAYAAPIVNKKETSRLVRELNSLYHLNGFQHIKRVRACKDSLHPLEILLCLVSEAPGTKICSIESLLPSDKVRHDGLGEPFVVKIPAHPPLTRAQFEQASNHWPTSFHEDKQVTVALKGELFGPLQKARMQMYMMSALIAAKEGRDFGMEPVGAVVVDPVLDKIIAVGHDCRDDHPLHHAVMVCIDIVAWSQGGGCYSFDRYPGCRFTSPSPSAASGSNAFNDIPDVELCTQSYICSGYDLYVTREPCVMCAMALVHSRIGRVFYGIAVADGALGSKYKIHSQKHLNHHFEVYKGVLGKQCEELYRLDDHIKNESQEGCTK